MRSLFLVMGVLLLVLASGCVFRGNGFQGGDGMQGATVQFGGVDGAKLTGTLWKSSSADKPGLILVHQLGTDRHDFDDFAMFAAKNGFTVLSFDMRGHGESRAGGLSYLNFTATDWQKVAGDIQSARTFLNVEKVLVVGASIGANSALNFGAKEKSCAGLVLLSPGLNYRGVDTTQSAQSNTCPFLAIASKEDQYAAQSSQTIFSTSKIADKKLLLVDNAGHGTAMWAAIPSLKQEVLDWLNAHA